MIKIRLRELGQPPSSGLSESSTSSMEITSKENVLRDDDKLWKNLNPFDCDTIKQDEEKRASTFQMDLKRKFKKTSDHLCGKATSHYGWVICQILLSSCHLALHWFNYFQMAPLSAYRGLMVGGPSDAQVWLLFSFSISAIIVYIFQTVNSLYVFKSVRKKTLIPISYEFLLTLPFSELPLAGVNYSIAYCSSHVMTSIQTTSASITVVFYFTRILWHAHMAGGEKHEIKFKAHLIFMCSCLTFSAVIAFPIMHWKTAVQVKMNEEFLKPSIFLLSQNFADGKIKRKFLLNRFLLLEGRDITRPYIIREISDIVMKGGVHKGSYKCNKQAKYQPIECTNATEILFAFKYTKDSGGWFGEIQFNAATIQIETNGKTCEEIGEKFQKGWRLHYLGTTIRKKSNFTGVYVYTPWSDFTCTTPMPFFNSRLKVCSNKTEYIKSVKEE
ncbi:DgyrCDS13720 [Dimorphilus gyrociliatus]|uniref:DgyrCDS13720 n=1 Tax=Dimorphilus gyrociliatus TaxID=2664684 RepID=A0A7I8WBN7_9ANNE|nr:DgyrCDS13720 [Dimorphilus gyrociliatus]